MPFVGPCIIAPDPVLDLKTLNWMWRVFNHGHLKEIVTGAVLLNLFFFIVIPLRLLPRHFCFPNCPFPWNIDTSDTYLVISGYYHSPLSGPQAIVIAEKFWFSKNPFSPLGSNITPGENAFTWVFIAFPLYHILIFHISFLYMDTWTSLYLMLPIQIGEIVIGISLPSLGLLPKEGSQDNAHTYSLSPPHK